MQNKAYITKAYRTSIVHKATRDTMNIPLGSSFKTNVSQKASSKHIRPLKSTKTKNQTSACKKKVNLNIDEKNYTFNTVENTNIYLNFRPQTGGNSRNQLGSTNEYYTQNLKPKKPVGVRIRTAHGKRPKSQLFR